MYSFSHEPEDNKTCYRFIAQDLTEDEALVLESQEMLRILVEMVAV